ncbi:hypothetical protein PTI98_002080 [Pleurotus ostreatus]|nr:hypothetical protein PTI98_002080 [Pleurotus ostreatus]
MLAREVEEEAARKESQPFSSKRLDFRDSLTDSEALIDLRREGAGTKQISSFPTRNLNSLFSSRNGDNGSVDAAERGRWARSFCLSALRYPQRKRDKTILLFHFLTIYRSLSALHSHRPYTVGPIALSREMRNAW